MTQAIEHLTVKYGLVTKVSVGFIPVFLMADEGGGDDPLPIPGPVGLTGSVGPTGMTGAQGPPGPVIIRDDTISEEAWMVPSINAANLTGIVPFASLQGLSSIVFGNLLAATVALSATNYFGPGDTTTTATETGARTVIPYAATIQKFYLRTSSAQPATGTFVFTVLKNGSATVVTFTIAAGAAAALFSDTTHSFTVAAGDEISIQAVNNGLALSAAIQGWSLEVDRTA